MHTEYACYDISINEEEVKQNVASAMKMKPSVISVHPYSVSYVKNLLDDSVLLSCVIDYPMGLNDTATRHSVISQIIAKQSRVNIIDISIPSKLIVNRKYDKFREDIKTNMEICQKHNIELRYMLEYRIFSHEILAKVCQILKTFDIKRVLPSSGFMLDDINDNIIAAKYLMAKTGIEVVCNGNIWHKTHIDNVHKSGVYGLRVNHLASLELLVKNNSI
jgi:deoxyribose-phosphate aldolase